MTNPMTAARTEVAAALTGLVDAQVFTYPPGSMAGPAVVVTADEVAARGHVTLTVTISAPVAALPTSLELVEELAWQVREAVAAAGLGWQEISRVQTDPDAQRLYRTIQLTTRP